MTSADAHPPVNNNSHSHSTHHHHSHSPSTPTTSNAASPPNKRDLKSWWKGFKLPSKHQEASHGEVPSSSSPSAAFQNNIQNFCREVDSDCSPVVGGAILQQLLFVEDDFATPKAAVSSSDSLSKRTSQTLHELRSTFGMVFSRSPRARCSPFNTARYLSSILTFADTNAPGIFGVPLRQSIVYANVAISLVDDDGKSYIYGYVPIVVAKCGVYLKEKGLCYGNAHSRHGANN